MQHFLLFFLADLCCCEGFLFRGVNNFETAEFIKGCIFS